MTDAQVEQGYGMEMLTVFRAQQTFMTEQMGSQGSEEALNQGVRAEPSGLQSTNDRHVPRL